MISLHLVLTLLLSISMIIIINGGDLNEEDQQLIESVSLNKRINYFIININDFIIIFITKGAQMLSFKSSQKKRST